MNAIYLGVFWMLYYTIHSALASHRAKRLLAGSLPGLYHWYRLFFTLFSAINFALLVWFHYITPSQLVFKSHFIIQLAGFIIGGAGAIVFFKSMAQYDLSVWFSEKSTQENTLVTSGLNALVRHPLYFSAILGIVALFLIFPQWKNLVFGGVSLLYIVLGAMWEEQKLVRKFGDSYRNYQKKTKMLIPFLF